MFPSLFLRVQLRMNETRPLKLAIVFNWDVDPAWDSIPDFLLPTLHRRQDVLYEEKEYSRFNFDNDHKFMKEKI
jgi:hypothetical protein